MIFTMYVSVDDGRVHCMGCFLATLQSADITIDARHFAAVSAELVPVEDGHGTHITNGRRV